jgi:FRG domain
MPASPVSLTKAQQSRVNRRAVSCPIIEVQIENLAEFLTVLGMTGVLWCRGHEDLRYDLVPSALRYTTEELRNAALNLMVDFRRLGEIKLARPPRWDEEFRWVQIAQHYGLPTRLLDWTESPTVALYFASQNPQADGGVYVMNPVDLNRASFPRRPRILDQHQDARILEQYLRLSGSATVKKKLKTVAINPVWNSERLMAQKGVFTLHGTEFHLDSDQAPSLVFIPVLREFKLHLQRDLDRIGIDEMSMFPELEHTCRFLKKRAGL